MSESYPCRLCFATDTDRRMNIFSDVGIQLKMSEIICEHFRCEVNKFINICLYHLTWGFFFFQQISEVDSMPNFVCEICWQTTEAFHELYQKSKTAQEKFLNPMIKIEVDTIGLWPDNLERDFVGDLPIDVHEIKSETNLGTI